MPMLFAAVSLSRMAMKARPVGERIRLSVPMMTGPSVADLSDAVGKHAPLITLDAQGSDLNATPFPKTFGLVPGVEGPGLPANLRANSRKIPMAAGVESLNAAVATGIALYAWHTQRGS